MMELSDPSDPRSEAGRRESAIQTLISQRDKAIDDLETLRAEVAAGRPVAAVFKGSIVTESDLDALLARVRAQVAEDIAQAIEDNVRHEDEEKQDRGGFTSFTGRMAYVAGHDKAARIARKQAGKAFPSSPAALPDVVGTRQRVGRCGDAMPPLVDVRPRHFCALPAGHTGWHRSDEGAEWSRPDDGQRRCPAVHPRFGQCELYVGHVKPDDDRHRTGSLRWPTAEGGGVADLSNAPERHVDRLPEE